MNHEFETNKQGGTFCKRCGDVKVWPEAAQKECKGGNNLLPTPEFSGGDMNLTPKV